ncbi:hypothetical protein K2173_015597 [Erythroxylum novogranatense]|uniref:Uncharacterized protein n=1 Tax=Erythroxylum novogranatense TaxID=1862640 RepID=A0AAV8SEI1_9ROSI|nr:hypothetical protein K2173_015597 [Erythroxylum novogranatense]
MEAADRPHRSNIINSTTISELFICFTSRLSSSSSMRISFKSILSPGRAREPTPISLSNSLSRRLRSNGSMKGGQASPMFPTTNAKKRGGSFENPEPTSLKVTCIGQVRVKTKKQSNKLRTRSKSRGEASFRRIEQNNSNKNVEASRNSDQNQSFANHHFLNQQQPQECLANRNQRWVHLPMTICEAVRAFGAEFNCFLPCRSSCMASEKEKEEKATTHSENGNLCGTVFARWLVAVQEGDGKGRQIELVVGEDEQREESSAERGRRRVFEEIEFKDENLDGGNGSLQEEEPRMLFCLLNISLNYFLLYGYLKFPTICYFAYCLVYFKNYLA